MGERIELFQSYYANVSNFQILTPLKEFVVDLATAENYAAGSLLVSFMIKDFLEGTFG